jgi:lysophospholipase L1-like esterase
MIREVACLGDSITLGRAQATFGYPDQLKVLEPSWGVANFGEGGDYVDGMAARYAAVIANRGFTDLVFLGGTNNASRGDDPATVLVTATAFWDEVRADGINLYLCEIMPRGEAAGHTPTIQTFIDTFNAGIAAYVLAHPEVVKIPLYTLMESGVTPDYLDATFFYDGLHVNQAGQDFIALKVQEYMS